MSDAHKTIIASIFEKIWNQQDLEAVLEIYREDFVAHIANTTGAIKGSEAFSQFVALFQALHPELTFTVEDQIAEGDKVATRWKARTPDLGGDAAMTGISIHRLADGRVAESWDNWDSVGELQAMGKDVFDKIGMSL